MSLVHTFIVDDGGFQRELHTESRPLVAGQQVIWVYRRLRPYSPLRDVAAEVVQVSEQRIRIRAYTASDEAKFFWVNRKNIRPRAPGEPAEPYPE